MKVEIEIPDLSRWVEGFPEYWMQLIFGGNRPPDPTGHSLLTGYIRLTEAAVRFYERGRLLTQHAWTTHTQIELGALNDASTSFEASFTNLYRAALFMIQIRRSLLLDQAFRRGLGDKPTFVSNIDRIRAFRRRIHHLDADILSGKIASGKPNFLQSEGDISKQNGVDVKVIHRLQIGDMQVSFKEIASWLTEMAEAGAHISSHRW